MAFRWEKPKPGQFVISAVVMGFASMVWTRDALLGGVLFLTPFVAYVTGLRPKTEEEPGEPLSQTPAASKAEPESTDKAA